MILLDCFVMLFIFLYCYYHFMRDVYMILVNLFWRLFLFLSGIDIIPLFILCSFNTEYKDNQWRNFAKIFSDKNIS